ncbi:MAG: hypothetical protein HGA37_14500, partial [Lentimicrobium sp.]|nr:hypothetical protein [Lentimicrobium sp.]
SLLATVLAMRLAGATINTMTLGGMAIALGALVDDAIIALIPEQPLYFSGSTAQD